MGKKLTAMEMQRTGENPKVEGTQWTDVNLRAEAARSHARASIETRERTNVWTINHKERSELGNVFRRLDRGADLWDTLNRRQS